MYPDPKIYVLRGVISEKEMARLRELAAPIVSIPKCMGVDNFSWLGGGGGDVATPNFVTTLIIGLRPWQR